MAIQTAERDVRERAYSLWEARGRPEGDAYEDWFAAERQIAAELDAVSTPLEPLAQAAADVLEDGVIEQSEDAEDAEDANAAAVVESPFADSPKKARRRFQASQ